MVDRHAEKIPPQVMMICPLPFPGFQGTQALLADLIASLHPAIAHIDVLSYASAFGKRRDDLPVTRIARDWVGAQSGPSLARIQADLALLKLAKSRPKPDLIHAHNIEGLALGALLKRHFSVPLVYHAHNLMRHELPTYAHPTLAPLLKLCGHTLDTLLANAADQIIAFTPSHTQSLIQMGFPAEHVHTIPPGLTPFSPQGEPPQTLLLPNEGARGPEGSGGAPSLSRGGARPRGPEQRAAWLATEIEKRSSTPLPIIYSGNPDRYQNLPLLYQALTHLHPKPMLHIYSHHPETAFRKELQTHNMRPGQDYRFETLTPENWHRPHRSEAIFACPRTLPGGAPIKAINALQAGQALVATQIGGELFKASIPLAEPTPESFAEHLHLAGQEPQAYRTDQVCSAEAAAKLYEKLYADVLRANNAST